MNLDQNYKVVNSPIKWVGGKSRFRKQIVSLIPKHTCYVEPFAGAAWVLFAKPPSEVEVLNDIDDELITFFRVVKNQPKEFLSTFKWELVSRSEFERLANLDTSCLGDLERAHRFYYLIMAGWGGELNYPRFQTSITDGGHGNRLFGAIKTLEKRIKPVYERLKTVIIENLDWADCIARYDSPTTVMYIDPPYPKNGANYRHNMKSWEEHRLLAQRLKGIKSKWILSSYDIPEMYRLYDGDCYQFFKIQKYSGMKKKKNGSTMVLNKEILVTNYDASEEALHPDDSLVQGKLHI